MYFLHTSNANKIISDIGLIRKQSALKHSFVKKNMLATFDIIDSDLKNRKKIVDSKTVLGITSKSD